ncbi:MAG: hypothetical protein PHS19_00770 [Eubacteriales bacterium]|nr:hypothetical protein [Eubacteriales bacterium]
MFEGINNTKVGEIISNYEFKRERNGIAKENVEELIGKVCNMYEQNQVLPEEHNALKSKAASLE